MSALLRGLNEGLQTGLRLGGTLRDVRQRQALADEAARFNVTEGAYGPELEQNIEQVRGLMTEAQRQAAAQGGTVEDMARIEAQYMPSIQELQRRSQMTAPDFTVASRAMRPEDTFATREAATRAARPMRAEGLANVYERFGEIERAEGLREQADTARMRASQIRRTEREDEQLGKLDKVNTQAAEWMNKRLTGEDGQLRAPTTEDTIAGIQHRASLLQQAGLADQAASAFQQYMSTAANQINLQTAERNQALSSVAVAISAGNFGPVQDFYDRFIPDGAKVTDVKEGRDGRITVNRTTLDGEKLPATSFANRNEMLAALNAIRDPMSLYNYSQQEFQNNLARERLGLERDRNARERSQLIRVEDAQGNLQLIDTTRLPRDANGQPIMPAGLRREGARSEAKPLTGRQQLAFDTVKGTERYKRAAEMGDIPTMREILTANNIPPEALLGDIALPPGQGAAAANPWAPPTPAAQPARPAAAAAQPAAETPTAPAQQGPSPAALRALRERPITRFTTGDVVEAAAAAGNPAAIRELNARQAAAERTAQRTQEQLRGLQ